MSNFRDHVDYTRTPHDKSVCFLRLPKLAPHLLHALIRDAQREYKRVIIQ